MIVDTFTNETLGVELTPNVAKTSRAYSLPQAVNVALNGSVYVQNFGKVNCKLQVEFVIHESNDAALRSTWRNADLVKVVDDGKVYYGYIVSLTLDNAYVDGYHKGTVVLQEEEVAT